jgi:outer membrane protein TolC
MRTNPIRRFLFVAGILATGCTAQAPIPGTLTPRGSRSHSQQQPSAQRLTGVPTNGLLGSVSSGPATTETLNLTLQDALGRGFQYNLALVESGEDVRLRRAERLKTLSRLLPDVNIRPSVTGQQVNLAAFGFSGFPGIPSTVGPFSVLDARANLSHSLVDIRELRNLKADRENEAAAGWLSRDLREQVAVVVTGLYLQTLAATARVEAQQAQLAAAEVAYGLAVDRKKAGTVPGIDVLRAQVQRDNDQQRLIYYEGELDKRKIDLARAIGLAPGQPFKLTDSMPDDPLPQGVTFEATIEQAYAQRADYRAAQSAVRAAEFARAAAQAWRYPTADVDANYGVIGPSPDQAHGTFAIVAGVRIPVFQGGRTKAEVDEADTVLRRRRAELEDLRSRIEAEVRTAFTDVRSAARQVEVAKGGGDLAREQLDQARDRFAAGVTNNLEVVQAQQSVAAASENYISALYALNLAKASFVRARGNAAQSIQESVRRRQP